MDHTVGSKELLTNNIFIDLSEAPENKSVVQRATF
jgi:hypothetical protein